MQTQPSTSRLRPSPSCARATGVPAHTADTLHLLATLALGPALPPQLNSCCFRHHRQPAAACSCRLHAAAAWTKNTSAVDAIPTAVARLGAPLRRRVLHRPAGGRPPRLSARPAGPSSDGCKQWRIVSCLSADKHFLQCPGWLWRPMVLLFTWHCGVKALTHRRHPILCQSLFGLA